MEKWVQPLNLPLRELRHPQLHNHAVMQGYQGDAWPKESDLYRRLLGISRESHEFSKSRITRAC
jgi:hypothetical protein